MFLQCADPMEDSDSYTVVFEFDSARALCGQVFIFVSRGRRQAADGKML